MSKLNGYGSRGADFSFERREGGYALPVDLESYSLFRFTVILAGEAIYTAGGRAYSAGAGDTVVTPDGVPSRLACSEGGAYVAIACPPHYLSEGMRSRFRSGSPIYRMGGEALDEHVRLIESEWLSDGEFRTEALRAAVMAMAIYLLRSGAVSGEVAESSPAVTATLAYIREHFGEKVSLGDMAKMTKVSVAYLSRKFKAEVGLGFADYLASLRLEKAEEMLCDHREMSVTEVAFLCGFNDSNYFSDKFKRRFGLSPLKYRQRSMSV